MIWVLVLIFAIHLEMNSENREPAKPNTAQKNQQLIEVEINPVGRHEPVEAEEAQGDAGNQHDRQVSGQEQQDAHHGCEKSPRAKDVALCGVYKVPPQAIQLADYFKLCPTAVLNV
nr:hypothetical protein GCM10020185_07840 [Pseudomonas brassicacearum subsp. brassicacearum]